jgi:hypothetical protein
MSTFLSFKRLSAIGAAGLILIMVLMLYPVLPPEPHQAHAATRLGLFFTQEELNCWRQRAGLVPPNSLTPNCTVKYRTGGDVSTNSPGDWTMILASANAFRSSPSSQRILGQPAGVCLDDGSNTNPAGDQNFGIMDAGFAYLLTGDTTYGTAVHNEL